MLYVYVGSSKTDLIIQRNTQMTNIAARLSWLRRKIWLGKTSTTLIELLQSTVAAVDSFFAATLLCWSSVSVVLISCKVNSFYVVRSALLLCHANMTSLIISWSSFHIRVTPGLQCLKENAIRILKLKTFLKKSDPIARYNVLNFEFSAILCYF